ncbi:MAG: beta-lactamase family protein [Verrucomicrobia bacterium]|nr:beta-lactamase family protein [Verrucomicrobiota bacterium]
MKTVLYPVLAAAFLVVATRTRAEVRPPERFASVREFVQNAIAEERIPSAAIAVIQNNSLVWAEGFGLADLEERRPALALNPCPNQLGL